MSWPLVKLGELCTVVRGSSPRPQGDPRYYGGHVPRLMVSDVTRDGKYVTPKIDYLTEAGAKLSRPMEKGDFVIAVSGQPGQPLILAVDACIHDGFAGLRNLDEERVHKDYLFHFMMNAKAKFSATAVGAIFKNLTTDQIKELELPLPPLEEQKRIAAILDKADAIRRKRQQAIKLADDFLRSVFLEMFGDPVTNPKGWEVRPVGEVADCIVPGRDKPKSFTGSTPWVTTNDLNHLGFTHCSKSNIGLSGEEIKNVRARVVPKNSVLMTCVGDLGVVSISANDMVINQQLHAFLPSGKYASTYLAYALSFQKGYMTSMASSTTLPYMNKTICNGVPVMVPSLSFQIKFESIFMRVNELKNKLQRQEINPLSNSLSQKAFSGNL